MSERDPNAWQALWKPPEEAQREEYERDAIAEAQAMRPIEDEPEDLG